MPSSWMVIPIFWTCILHRLSSYCASIPQPGGILPSESSAGCCSNILYSVFPRRFPLASYNPSSIRNVHGSDSFCIEGRVLFCPCESGGDCGNKSAPHRQGSENKSPRLCNLILLRYDGWSAHRCSHRLHIFFPGPIPLLGPYTVLSGGILNTFSAGSPSVFHSDIGISSFLPCPDGDRSVYIPRAIKRYPSFSHSRMPSGYFFPSDPRANRTIFSSRNSHN